MFWFIISLCSCLSVEIVYRLSPKTHFYIIVEQIKKILFLLRSRHISDHWRERVLPIYSINLLFLSLKIMVGFIVIASPFSALFVIDIYVYPNSDFLKPLMTIPAFLILTLITCIYGYFRVSLNG